MLKDEVKGKIILLKGRCAEIRRQRLIRSRMKQLRLCSTRRSQYLPSAKHPTQAYVTAASSSRGQVPHTMADEPAPPLTPSTPATRAAKPVSEALLNDKVLIMQFLLRSVKPEASSC